MRRMVADLGNSRIKWAECGADGQLLKVQARALDASGAWAEKVDARPDDVWVVASVNPAAAGVLEGLLESTRGVEAPIASSRDAWFRSAAEVPLRFGHALAHPERTGADRALGAGRAVELMGPETGGVVVSVGSALVVERIAPGGLWVGGAISAGWGPLARALKQSTAQLPEVVVGEAPPAWGDSTEPALAAGLFWGLVGSARELVARQKVGLAEGAWTVWTGGDAGRIAPWVEGAEARIVPDLVLQALGRLGFESDMGAERE